MASYLAWLEETPLDQLPPGEDLTAGERIITVNVVVPGEAAGTDDEAIDLIGTRLDGLYWTGSLRGTAAP